jgi:hypothetical protein
LARRPFSSISRASEVIPQGLMDKDLLNYVKPEEEFKDNNYVLRLRYNTLPLKYEKFVESRQVPVIIDKFGPTYAKKVQELVP